MKICSYHNDALRQALYERFAYTEDNFYRAQALLLLSVTEHDPSFAIEHAHDLCPICHFIVPSWIDKAAQSILETTPERPS
jgi:hypothetical protein